MGDDKDSVKQRRPSGLSLRKRSSGFFSRSSRNSLSGDRNLDSRAGPTSPTLDFLPKISTSLTEDRSLSRFFSKQRTPATIAEDPNAPVKAAAPAPAAATATQPSNASIYSRSATMRSRPSGDTGPLSDYQYQSTILTLQTKIMTESQEKDAILAKYSALLKIHDAQRTEMSSYKLGKPAAANSANASAAPTTSQARTSPVVANGTVAAPAPAKQEQAQPQYDQVRHLITNLHEWIFANFNDSSIDLDKLSSEDKSILERVTPTDVSVSKVPKTAVLQALATSSFLNVFNDAFFPALPSKFDSLKASHDLLKDAPAPATLSKWRASTASALLALDDAALKESAEALAKRVAESIDTHASNLASAKPDDARLQKITTIVEAAVAQARQLRTEDADFDFRLPAQSASRAIAFDADVMENVSVGATSTKADAVQIVLSPVVYRIADGGSKSVVLKSRVLA